MKKIPDPGDIFRLSERVTVVPVIHGSGDCTLALRRELLNRTFDCLAVPLPPSCQEYVEEAITKLPLISVVMEPSHGEMLTGGSNDGDSLDICSYTPVEPCQPVIAAIRLAMGEHVPRAFIDPEVPATRDSALVMPDPYAMKRISIDQFSTAILPFLPRPTLPRQIERIDWLASQLRRLESQYTAILLPCAIADWPWIRESYRRQSDNATAHRQLAEAQSTAWSEPKIRHPTLESLYFMLGELPFIAQLHVEYQNKLKDDSNVSVDGIKELLIAARKTYVAEYGRRARTVSPQLLSQCLKYIRNLTLMDRRLTPDLYTIVTAAKQVLGDGYAMHVAYLAREYRFQDFMYEDDMDMGIDRARLPDESIVALVSRLPGPPIVWRSVELRRQPTRRQQQSWQMRWDPFRQCSWPPEDQKIEQFRTHVADRARAILGDDLARHEKFTTSIKDGIDVRESLRHWHTGELYVKVIPPARGPLDAIVMLFDSPADPREYPWRTTWYAEHAKESTLAFYATNFRDDLIGPGIGLAQYGGAMFLFPPRPIVDVWQDPRLEFTETLEERLLAASCLHSKSRHIALLAPLPPGAGWRRLAKRFRKKFVYLPLSRFGASTVAQLRMVHVLNGHQVRSYAAEFIRRA